MKDLVRAMIEEELRSSEMKNDDSPEFGAVGGRIAQRIVRCARIASAMHMAEAPNADSSSGGRIGTQRASAEVMT